MKLFRNFIFIFLFTCTTVLHAQNKAVFLIVDGIPADVLEKTPTPFIDEIAREGGYTRAWLGGEKGGYSESPTISAVGYNTLLTGTWSNKHNVWGNSIRQPNYHYQTIFRIAEEANPNLKTAVFSTWLDNRTRLIGERLPENGNILIDYAFDGFENDTVAFPHRGRKYIFDIDEHVSKEAGRYIRANGPDLSWVYLEYTDDIGHMHGDSPEMTEAVKAADVQIGRVWEAVKERMRQTGENWMIVVTTDHGRDAATGKDHGGQSEREKTIWIATNYKPLNVHYNQNPAMVDIMPSMLRFLDIQMPAKIEEEIDGVSFIGKVSMSNLKAGLSKTNRQMVRLSWKVLDPDGEVEIWVSTTNQFKEGDSDHYQLVGKTETSKGEFTFDISQMKSTFYKILVKAPYNFQNQWVVL
ncbi:MAG: alkaline phosphatase family protein [Prolixibacteraceae bacterium]